LKKVFAEKHSKIEDLDGLIEGIRQDCGEKAASIIIPLLDLGGDSKGNAGKLSEALSKVN